MKWWIRAILLYFAPSLTLLLLYGYMVIFENNLQMGYWDLFGLFRLKDLTIALLFISFAAPYALSYEEALNITTRYERGRILGELFYIFPISIYSLDDIYVFGSYDYVFSYMFILAFMILSINYFVYKDIDYDIDMKKRNRG